VKEVRFHPAARRELLHAADWYLERSPTAAAGFEEEIAHAIERITEAPERYAITRTDRRRFVLLKYPFNIVYRIREDHIEIVAVAHNSRRPGYWLGR
jgi:plasmid stabilization system protein ParE